MLSFCREVVRVRVWDLGFCDFDVVFVFGGDVY